MKLRPVFLLADLVFTLLGARISAAQASITNVTLQDGLGHTQSVFPMGTQVVGVRFEHSNVVPNCTYRFEVDSPSGIKLTTANIPSGLTKPSKEFGWVWNITWDSFSEPGTWHYHLYVNDVDMKVDVPFTVKRQVLMVHGLWSDPSVWDSLTATLSPGSFMPTAIDFNTTPETNGGAYGPGEAPIEAQAVALAKKITLMATDATKRIHTEPDIDLVCHSMGGLAARYYLEHEELWPVDSATHVPGACIRKFVTLGTPHWGTDIMYCDPVATIFVAREFGGENCAKNVDLVSKWSPGLSEMFSEWGPPPPSLAAPPHGYPANWAHLLDEWSPAGVSYASPISPTAVSLAGFGWLYPTNDAKRAVMAADALFGPEATRESVHRRYYLGALRSGTVLWPTGSSPSTDGVSSRYVSSFLADLNSPSRLATLGSSGAKVYAIAGNNSSFYGFLSGPWNSLRVANDGLVPTLSAEGFDPIKRTYVTSSVAVFPVNHSDLCADYRPLYQVRDWLTAAN